MSQSRVSRQDRAPRTRRDPEGRRRALGQACAELIAELGTGRVTHRVVARRAGVPLGSTTYYFAGRDDLIAAGLAVITAEAEQELARWERALRDCYDVPTVLAQLVCDYLSDRDKALVEYDLYLAAARDGSLRPMALRWLQGAVDVLEPRVGTERATDIIALLDGVMIQAVVTDRSVEAVRLAATITRFLD